ncbi:MAG TPA: FtsX-like permease family protein, partial [Bryobacteraceae bacterium]|nr:FtsX-like permease family protein [Bryobacteraceae bacterium]
DTRILAFTLAVCVMTGLLFGLVPALATRKVDLAPALKVDARAAAGGRTRFRRALVVAQISLSALLLIAASQFLRSLANLHRVDLGMRGSRSVVAFSINPSLNGHSKEQSVQFYRALLEKLRSSAGIESVGAATIPVLNEDWWSASITLDDAGPQPDNNNPNANLISSGFLSALGIPLLAGRDFAPSDAAAKHRVALVNQAFARQFFGGRNPVGHWIGLDNTPGTKTDIEVVGLAKDSKFYNVRRDIRPQIYLDDDQNPDIQQIIVYLRTAMSPSAVSTLVRTVMRGLDPHVPVFALRTLDEQAELTLARENMIASLTSAFGLVAVVLAAIGIFGLMSFTVARRTREIAVRMALGARGGSVRWLIMREVLALAGFGVAIALPAAWALARLVQSQLYGVKPNDGAGIWLAVAALSVVAILSTYLPVRRAAAIDPMQALRAE